MMSTSKTKRILALILALTLVLGMSLTAIAEEPITEPPAEKAETADAVGTMGMLDLSAAPGDNGTTCDCNDPDCGDCNPWVCDDCGGTMATCACCAACDSLGCEACDPSLYDCNDCGVCYSCRSNGSVFNSEDLTEKTSTTLDVSDSAGLTTALTNPADGTVINVIASFTHNSSISITGVSVELRLNGNAINIDTGANDAIKLDSATLNVVGNGTINAKAATRAIIVENESELINTGVVINAEVTGQFETTTIKVENNSVATISSATGAIFAFDNSALTITGNASGLFQATKDSSIVVNGYVAGFLNAHSGNITICGNINANNLEVGSGANVTVNGNITGSIDVEGEGTTMTINGNVTSSVSAGNEASVTVTGSATGVISFRGGTITLNGNTSTAQAVMGGITTINGNVTNGDSECVVAWHGGTVTVNGNIASTGNVAVLVIGTSNNVTVNGTISANEFIHVLELIDNWRPVAVITAAQYDSIVNIGGTFYRQYTYNASTVLVKADDVVPSDTITEAAVKTAIAAGAPLILTGTDTNITGNILQLIKDSAETLEIILPNNVHISIDGKSFGNNPLPANFDLNVVLTATTTATTAGTATVPANSVIIAPASHGEFGFTIDIYIPASKLAEAGLSSGNLSLFYIDANGAISTVRTVQRQGNGSVIVSISSASQYFLSRTPSTSGRPGGAPQTGDYRTVLLPIVMILLGTLGLTGWIVYNKRIKKTSTQ